MKIDISILIVIVYIKEFEHKDVNAKEIRKANNLFSNRSKTCYLPTETGESVEAGSAWQFVEEITGAPH